MDRYDIGRHGGGMLSDVRTIIGILEVIITSLGDDAIISFHSIVLISGLSPLILSPGPLYNHDRAKPNTRVGLGWL